MKILTKKKNVQKIMIGLVIVLLFNFIVPNYSKAADENIIDWVIRPISFLFTTLFDGMNYLMQWAMIGGNPNVVISGDDAKQEWLSEHPVDGDDDQLATIIFDKADLFEGDEYVLPNIEYTPSQIFSGQVAALDVNFFKSETDDSLLGADEGKSSIESLRDIVSSWYSALRNLAIVGLLSVLVYLAIRMIISSSNPEKAKYKQSLADWLVALCLVFFLHYIMAFTLAITEGVTDMINTSTENGHEVIIRVVTTDGDLTEAPPSSVTSEDEIGVELTTEVEFPTTLVGAARFQQQYSDATKKLSYMTIYIALTIYTAMFTFTYLKRLLNMTFLTLIAPMVALTYPLDKATDGKAQAFNMWLREYMFNALLQPLHLLLYTVLVGSAIQLAANNIIYAIAALAFILPAEKLLKTMFNFRNGNTDSSLGGFAGGMLTSKMLDTVGRVGKMGRRGGQNKSGNPKIRTQENKQMKDQAAKKAGREALNQDIFGGTALPESAPEGAPALVTGGATGTPGARGATNGTPTGAGGAQSSIVAGTDTSGWASPAGILYNPNSASFSTSSSADSTPTPPRTVNTPGDTPTPEQVGATRPSYMTPLNANRPKRGLKQRATSIKKGIQYTADKKFREAGGVKGILGSAGRLAGKGLIGAATLGVGTGLASIAAAGTIVSGGKNAEKYFGAAALATGAVGKGLSNAAGAIGGTASGLVRDVRMGMAAVDDDTKSKLLEKQAKNFAKDTDNRDFFREKMNVGTKEELDQVMDVAAEYNNAGVTNLERIKDGMKIEQKIMESDEFKNKYKDASSEERLQAARNLSIGVSQESSKMSDDVVNNTEEFENRRKALQETLERNGMSKKAAEANSTYYYNLIKDARRG